MKKLYEKTISELELPKLIIVMKARQGFSESDATMIMFKELLKKWATAIVKEVEKTPETYYQLPDEPMYKIGFYHQAEKKAVIELLKWAFKITEEDLKK